LRSRPRRAAAGGESTHAPRGETRDSLLGHVDGVAMYVAGEDLTAEAQAAAAA